MASKRPCGPPTGNTPGKSQPKLSRSPSQPTSRKSLFNNIGETIEKPCNKKVPWTEQETKTLVQYICLYAEDAWKNKWPSNKDQEFWGKCAEAINKTCSSSRTGLSCRTRALKNLAKKYATLKDAEEDLNIDYVEDCINLWDEPLNTLQHERVDYQTLSPIFKASPINRSTESRATVGDIVRDFDASFKSTMSPRLKEQLVKYFYKQMVIESGGINFFKFVGADFLNISLNAMQTLFMAEKHNLLHSLSECFATKDNELPTRMPLDRMPFGLIDYNLRFFAANRAQKLGMEQHYTQWLETMFAHFGHKWACLHRGPYWQYEVEELTELQQRECDLDSSNSSNILESALEMSGIDLSGEFRTDVNQLDNGDGELEQQIHSTQNDEKVMITSVPVPGKNCQEDLDASEEYLHETVTQLWSHIREKQQETLAGLHVQKDIEKLHGVVPDAAKPKCRPQVPGIYDPLKSKVNIASVSVRQIQKHISNSSFTRTVDIQVEALKDAKRNNQKGRWWIKADACDVRAGLRESMRGEWSGDEDLGNGSVQILHKLYKSRCNSVRIMEPCHITKFKSDLEDDITFLKEANTAATLDYEAALNVPGKREQKLMELAWNVTGIEELLKQANEFYH